MDKDTEDLFALHEIVPWHAEWQNMPEYSHEDLAPRFQIIMNFACAADLDEFAQLIGQKISHAVGRQSKSFWFPAQEINRMTNKRYIERKVQ